MTTIKETFLKAYIDTPGQLERALLEFPTTLDSHVRADFEIDPALGTEDATAIVTWFVADDGPVFGCAAHGDVIAYKFGKDFSAEDIIEAKTRFYYFILEQRKRPPFPQDAVAYDPEFGYVVLDGREYAVTSETAMARLLAYLAMYGGSASIRIAGPYGVSIRATVHDGMIAVYVDGMRVFRIDLSGHTVWEIVEAIRQAVAEAIAEREASRRLARNRAFESLSADADAGERDYGCVM